jgi:ubiquitin C-terminal hydrolase
MTDISEKSKEYYIGLANLGNTCFLNSCIQVLNHIEEFHELLTGKIETIRKKTDVDSLFTQEYYDLRQMMRTNNQGILSPNRFVNVLQMVAKEKNQVNFTGWSQNDISDVLHFMMENIHKSICRKTKFKINGKIENEKDVLAKKCYTILNDFYKREYSEVLELFYGIQYTVIESIDGQIEHSLRPELFMTVDLPISRNSNLYDCLEEFMRPEILEGENAWLNEKTGHKEDISKKIMFWSFPNILIFVFKRYNQTGSRKTGFLIDFPIDELDLSKYVSGYKPESYVYELMGIGNHSGGLLGGHYTSYARSPKGKWIHYNDATVSYVTDVSKMISPKAYCLFYRKKNWR